MNGVHKDKSLRDLLRPRFKRWPTPDPRTDILVATTLQLMMEVEALRQALINLEAQGVGSASAYGRAYRDTAYLTHNSAGPSSGLDKLLARFESDDVEQPPSGREPRVWEETPMLRRLRFSEEEISAYKVEALDAETFT
jgi:hypothetical protein